MNRQTIINMFEFKYYDYAGKILVEGTLSKEKIENIADDIITLYNKEIQPIKENNETLKLENAILSAKVNAYENIIASSNFAPVLKENRKIKKESKGE